MIASLKTTIEKSLYWFVPVSLLLVLLGIYISAGDRINFWHGGALRGFGAWTLGILLVGVAIKRMFRLRASAALLVFLLLFLFVVIFAIIRDVVVFILFFFLFLMFDLHRFLLCFFI